MLLHILSGGAAQALVGGHAEALRAQTGLEIAGTFGAVGAMRDKLVAGAPADLVILSQPMIAELIAEGRLVEDSDIDIGTVLTGIAVRAADPVPDVATSVGLREALRAADAIFLPDPEKATAGIHLAKVMRQLGIAAEMAPRLRAFPNGHAAMTAMSVHCQGTAIGCTQITEILAVPGVALAGPLPHELELATVYTAAIAKSAREAAAARWLAETMAGNAAADLRERLGFS